MEFIVGIAVILAIIVFFSMMSKSKANRLYNDALIKFSFKHDYISTNRDISIESQSKRIMINTPAGYKVYESQDVSSWSIGHAYRDEHPKYYLEFIVKDLDCPNIKVWFGGFSQERDTWNARVTALYNG